MAIDLLGTILIALLAVGTVLLSMWLQQRSERRIASGDWTGASISDVTTLLWSQYEAGRVDPDALARATKLEPPLFFRGMTLNRLVCFDVAAGRYAEALQWRERWKWKKRLLSFDDEVIRVNEAEALACLGRLEEALQHAPKKGDLRFPMLEAGVAAHRAWVLAELGRLEEARAEHAAHARAVFALGKFEAEWHFSRFAVELTARNWDAASAALDDADRVARRESSKRNVHFLRGRLAFARGNFEEAVKHFEAGAQSLYQWQGGAALLDWGAALAKLGRTVEANEAWRRCLTQDPQSPAAKKSLSRLGEGLG